MKKNHKKLIHRAIDGEANQSETRMLRRVLKEDVQIHQEYHKLKKVVQGTDHLKMDVPRGFTKKVMKDLTGQNPRSPGRPRA